MRPSGKVFGPFIRRKSSWYLKKSRNKLFRYSEEATRKINSNKSVSYIVICAIRTSEKNPDKNGANWVLYSFSHWLRLNELFQRSSFHASKGTNLHQLKFDWLRAVEVIFNALWRRLIKPILSLITHWHSQVDVQTSWYWTAFLKLSGECFLQTITVFW